MKDGIQNKVSSILPTEIRHAMKNVFFYVEPVLSSRRKPLNMFDIYFVLKELH
jgi:hypothetical protein